MIYRNKKITLQDDRHHAGEPAERHGRLERVHRHSRQSNAEGRVEDGQRGRRAVNHHHQLCGRGRSADRLQGQVPLLPGNRQGVRPVLRVHCSHGTGEKEEFVLFTVKSLAIYSYENMPNSIKNCQSRFKILPSTN